MCLQEPCWLVKRILRIKVSTESTSMAASVTLNQQEGNSYGVQSFRTSNGSIKRQYSTLGDTKSTPDNNGSTSTGTIAPRSLVDAIAATIGMGNSSSDGSMPAAQSVWGSIMNLRAPQLLPTPTAAGLPHHGLLQHQANFVKCEIRRIDSLSSAGSSSGGSSSGGAGQVVQQAAREMSPETAAGVQKSRAVVQVMAECIAQLRAMGHEQ
jgi:hypothetical protein